MLNYRKKEKSIIKKVAIILSNGLFYFRENSIKKHSIKSLFNIKLLLHTHIVFSKNKVAPNNCVTLEKGYIKIFVALSQEFAFCFYREDHLNQFYYDLKERWNFYKGIINYPIIEPLLFDDKSLLIQTKRVIGIFHNSSKDDQLMKSLLDFALGAKTQIVDGKICYLQHGDVKDENIIWINQNKFVFIDIDFVGFKPILYDCIHLVLSRPDPAKKLSYFFQAFQGDISLLFSKYNLEFNDSTIDAILCDYISFLFPDDKKKLYGIIDTKQFPNAFAVLHGQKNN